MANWAEEAFAPIEAVYRERVAQDTWGHLAPKKNISYKGQILTCRSGYGTADGQIIDSKFEGLQDSPWLFDAMGDMIWKIRDQMQEDGVYMIETTFRNYRWYNKKPLKVASL